MKEVIMPIGLPGIGKSTTLNREFGDMPRRYIGLDAIREELTGNESDLSRDTEVKRLAKDRFVRALQSPAAEDQCIVLDATFLTPAARKPFLDIIRKFGEDVLLRVFTFPNNPELAKARQKNRERQVPEFAIHRMSKAFKPFRPEEAQGINYVNKNVGDESKTA